MLFSTFTLVLTLAQDATAPRPEDLASIQGKVINRISREPVRFAEIMLQAADFEPETVKASADGAFAVDRLRPGRYTLHPQKTGFTTVRPKPGTPPEYFVLEKGSKKTGIVLELNPQATITGRVTDEDGEPVSGAIVTVESAATANIIGVRPAQTNDRGEYRLFGVEPGRIRVRVTPVNVAQFMSSNPNGKTARVKPEAEAAAGSKDGPVPVYFPAATNAEQASVLELAPGDERQGVDVRLVKSRVFEVSGRVLPPPGWTGPGAGVTTMGSVSLTATQRTQFRMGGNGRIDAEGKFLLKYVAPGSYFLMANLMNAKTPARIRVEVTQNDVTNLEVPFYLPFTLVGSVKVPENLDLKGVRVMLRASDTFGVGGQGSVEAKGAFRIENLVPDQYMLRVMGPTASLYVKSVRLDGQEVDPDALNIKSSAGTDAGPLDVTLADDGGKIDGVVRTSTEAAHAGAFVLIWPDTAGPIAASLTKVARTGGEGKYELQGIRPGKYRLAAFDSLPSMSPLGAPDEAALQKLKTKAESISVDAGSKVTRDLKSLGDPE